MATAAISNVCLLDVWSETGVYFTMKNIVSLVKKEYFANENG